MVKLIKDLNYFLGLLFLRKFRRAKGSSTVGVEIAIWYIFSNNFIVFFTAVLSIIYSGRKFFSKKVIFRIRAVDNSGVFNNIKKKYFYSIFFNRRINDGLNDIKKFRNL